MIASIVPVVGVKQIYSAGTTTIPDLGVATMHRNL